MSNEIGLFFINVFAAYGPFNVINALWAQFAEFNNVLPEGDSLNSTVNLVYNIANLLCLFAMPFLHKCRKLNDFILLESMLILAVILLLLLGFLYKVTINNKISIVLLSVSFLSGIVGCFGVTYIFPTLSTSDKQKSAISIGLSLGGVTVNLISSIQQSTSTLLFSIQVFYIIASIIQVITIILVAWSRYLALNNKKHELEPLIEQVNDQAENQTKKQVQKIVSKYYGPMAIFCSSFFYYFATPNLFPYFSKNKSWRQTFNLLVSIFNFLGRLITITPITRYINRLEIIVCILVIFFIFEIIICFVHVHEAITATAISIHMFLAGYMSTIAYYGQVQKEEGDDIEDKIKANKQYQKNVSISNQIACLSASVCAFGFCKLIDYVK
ncbi:Conserved_hypothetical protein [Hexamita inflata]|uniref:Uncharacterized protein n=1 Tax=Hexamita inflata TaxID=28002 RepID=A0AA86QRU0_9EUKA|nr:Conserved hypothetical protein [Hexamita inflata]